MKKESEHSTSPTSKLQPSEQNAYSIPEAMELPETAYTEFPPLLNVILAGGIGGSTADFLMHSVDTVKTRLQGQRPTHPPKYNSMIHAYDVIYRQEGIQRGLYGGIKPAMLGSLPATMIYFGTYEFVKRFLTSHAVPDTLSHLTAGSFGDLLASSVYVPSEVLKTRLQLQGRYNNPHFFSGYNYKGTWHAAQMIVKYEGPAAFYHGYRATLLRDVPFSALQFAFYERFKLWAMKYTGSSTPYQLGLGWEILNGAFAGGLAGAITTPLDVMKTLLQTQVQKQVQKQAKRTLSSQQNASPPPIAPKYTYYYTGIWDGMMWNYNHQGVAGLFRGIGPRVAWTAMQSALMFVIYEQVLGLLPPDLWTLN